MNRRSLYPLPPLSIVLSQRQRMLQATGRLETEERRAMSRYGIGLIVLACVVFGRDAATDSVPELSDEQRSRIFDSVVRSDVPVAEVAAPEVADSLPAEVPTQDLPDDIIREIPLIHGHNS